MPAEPPGPAARCWVALCAEPLATELAARWVVRPGCGAVVSFVGTVRSFSEGREHVRSLEYEAYDPYALRGMREVADEALARWPELGAAALLHRTGLLEVTDPAVVIAVSAPHRAEAFAAASWCIDSVKATVPIWKREAWDGGVAWAAACDEEHARAGGLRE